MAASWECPSLPMLNLPLRETAKTTFLGLKPLISAHYEENPDSFTEEIRQLDMLREHSTRPTRDYNGCSVLRRYFAQLHLLRARFPPDKVGQIPVDFLWKDAYTGAEYIQEGLQMEQASILYNIAALHCQLGSYGKREVEQEMKEAVTHFQCAAGAFSYLDEHFAINHANRDLSPEFVTFYNSLMLGQAQECLVEKSLKGIGRVKNLTISRLAARVSEYYSRCISLLEGETCHIVAKKNKDWVKLLKFKVQYFQAIAHFYQAAHSEEMGKYGEMISLTQLTLQKLGSIAGKPPKGAGEVLRIARQNFADHVTEKLAVGRRQNDQVYHDPIPQLEHLELTTGTDLVKPVTFHPTDPKNLGTDIFARLIPMRAHEVASIFSEEKAKLMRSITSSVEEKNEELEQFMRSLNAQEIDKVHEGPPTVPDNVLKVHQSLQGKGEEVKKLQSSFQELMDLSKSVSEDIAVVAHLKEQEETEESSFQTQFGARPTSQVCSGLWKEMENYQKYNSQAVKSNSELKAMFDQHYPNLVLLTSPLASLKASLPKMTLLDAPAEEASESERWQELLKEVEKMRQQRLTLVSRFREQMSKDDITKNVVGHLGSDQESFLEEHMKQFKELASIIRQNLAAQENILAALTEANAKKASTRQTVQEITQQQQAMFASLLKSGKTLNILQTKVQEGTGFYRKLQGSVSRLRKRAEDVCEARQRERQALERQRSPQPPDSSATPPRATPPPPGLTPPRPPKKAELAGNPLPPADHTHHLPPGVEPPDHMVGRMELGQQPPNMNFIPSSTALGPSIPSSAHPDTLQDLQRTQQAMLNQLNAIPADEGRSPENIPRLPPLNQQGQPQIPPSSLSQPVPDAAQALNSLQLLLQPGNLAEPSLPGQPGTIPTQPEISGGLSGTGMVPDPSQAPHRPPKPSHMKSDPLPTPFPSLPASGDQPFEPSAVLPASSSIEAPHSGLPEGAPAMQFHSMPSGGPLPQNFPPGVAPSQGFLPKGSQVMNISSGGPPPPNIPPEGTLPPVTVASFQPPPTDIPLGSNAPPWAMQPPNIGGGGQQEIISKPPENIVTEEAPSQPHVSLPPNIPMSEQAQTFALSQPVTQVGPVEPITYLPNINLQPGEITLTTSSILGPIPSAQAVPTSPETSTTPTTPSLMSPPPAMTTSSTIPPAGPHSIPPIQPIQEPPETEMPQHVIPNQSEFGSTLSPIPPPASTPLPTEHQPATDSTTTQSTPQPPGSQSTEGPPPTVDSSTLPLGPGGSSMDDKTYQPVPTSEAALENKPMEDIPPSTLAEPVPKPTVQGLSQPEHQEAQPPPPHSQQLEVSATSTIAPVSTSVLETTMLPLTHSSGSLLAAPPTVPTLDAMGTGMLRDLPGVVPLSLTTLASLSTSLDLETPTHVSPLTTELTAGHLSLQQPTDTAQMKLLQNSFDEQKRVIEVQKEEIQSQKSQIAEYRQQMMQMQQQLSVLQQKQDQEKAAASGQQSALMQLLHQQQGMFSQQQSQIEKLSQLDESHRKEYMEVEAKFRETLKSEQEMKAALQNQNLQLMQENQKLNQMMQMQTQQVQTLQLQLQQYSVHIQERDKQLVAFKDQHKQIVDKLEQRNQQKIAQLIQRIQEMEARRSREGGPPPSLPQPLQPVVVAPPRPLNPQQNQDLGPAIAQPNLPPPMQPTVSKGQPEKGPSPLQHHPGNVQNIHPGPPSSLQQLNVQLPPQPAMSTSAQVQPQSTQAVQPQPQPQPQTPSHPHYQNRPSPSGPSVGMSPSPSQWQGQGGAGGSSGAAGTGIGSPQVPPQLGPGQVRPPQVHPQVQSPYIGGQQQPMQPNLPPGPLGSQMYHIGPETPKSTLSMPLQPQRPPPSPRPHLQTQGSVPGPAIPPQPGSRVQQPGMFPGPSEIQAQQFRHPHPQQMMPQMVPRPAQMPGQRMPGAPVGPNFPQGHPSQQPPPGQLPLRPGTGVQQYRGPTP